MINSPLVDCLGNSVMEEVGEVQFRRAICGDFLQAVWPEEGEVFRNLEELDYEELVKLGRRIGPRLGSKF